jgi:beta-N-acetylhexosaminidase
MNRERMTIPNYLLAPFILSLLYFAGCGPGNRLPQSARPVAEVRLGPDTPLGDDGREWVERTLRGLTVREMAAQVIVAWIPGSYVSTDSEEFDRAVELVESGVGGLWMMGGMPHARAAKINALQARAKVPLLVTADALAPRKDAWLLGRGTELPPRVAYGAIGDPGAAREACRIAAVENRAAGANFLMDGDPGNVLTNLDNVLIDRLYGGDPVQVARLTVACVQGTHDAGLLSTAGFFPGAGGVDEDPHVRLPVLRSDRNGLDTIRFIPYRQAIRAGVDAVMTSHFAVPALTGSDSLPATLSPEVIRVLREELGFNGLVITDAFDMGALTNSYDHLDAVTRAFRAGHDLLLGPSRFAAADRIAALVESGEIPRQGLEASVRRILEAKARLGLHERQAVSLEAVEQVVGRREHQLAAESAAARSIVLLRDRQGLVPLASLSEARVLSITLAREDTELNTVQAPWRGSVFNATLRDHVASLQAERISPATEESTYEELHRRARQSDYVLFNIYLGPRLGADPYRVELPDPAARFVRRLQSEGRRVVVVSFGLLKVLDRVPDLETFVLAWSGQDVMQRAAARALLGQAPISGRLPVALPPHHAIGDGLSRERASAVSNGR